MFIFQSENTSVKGHMHKNTVCHLEHGVTTAGDQCKVDFARGYYSMESAGRGNVRPDPLPPEPKFVNVKEPRNRFLQPM